MPSHELLHPQASAVLLTDDVKEATVASGTSRLGLSKKWGEPALSRMTGDLAELKGKIAHMPTLWQIAGTMLAINAGIVAVAGLAVALLRHAG